MVQVIYEQPESWPENESKTIRIPSLEVEIAVSPDKARRAANGFLNSEVSMTLHAANPVLIIEPGPVWRFTAEMRLRGLGPVAAVGAIEVDAQSGAVIPLNKTQIRAIQDQANAIIARLAHQTA
jgi:hypothetical protein